MEKISLKLFKEIFCLLEPNCNYKGMNKSDYLSCNKKPCIELEKAICLLKKQEKLTSYNSEYAKCPQCKGDIYKSITCLNCDWSESTE